MSSSGGIAKGSYQGGVDWTISEFLRRQRDPAFLTRVGLTPNDGFRLGSATGASAGNINALLIAISWCTAQLKLHNGVTTVPIPPEESLFWNTWVNTGFSEMLSKGYSRHPEKREPAVLDRRFFEKVHKGVVLSFLERGTPVPIDCDVPLGLTMTKLTPVKVTLTENKGSANVQRFATVLNVKVLGAGAARRIDFQAPRTEVAKAGSLGALALLPDLASDAAITRDLRLNKLFDVVLASSSFPVAFAPKCICYVPGGLIYDAASPLTCAMFNDGGLFDNNPFGLALGLFERNYPAGVHPQPPTPVPPVAVGYSNPNRYRRVLEQSRREPEGARDQAGIGAIVQMIQGALPSGREYELQSLARQIRRDSAMREERDDLRRAARTDLFLSSRSAPILGEHLGSFGAFLGRSFREYDFYTGIYDGLEFVARHFICGKLKGAAQDACTDAAHNALLDNNDFALGDLALRVARWHQALEYKVGSDTLLTMPSTASTDAVDHQRLVLLTGIRNAMLPLRKRPFEQKCTRRNDPIGSRLCVTALDEVLEELAEQNKAFIAAARHLRDWCNQPTQKEAKAHGECNADDEFVELLKSPRGHLHNLVERALNNLEDAEDVIKQTDGDVPEYSAFVEAAFSQYRASSNRYRLGIKGSKIDLNPSSARWDGRGASRSAGSVLAILAPNYFSVLGFGRSDETPADSGVGRTRETSITAGWHPIVIRAWEQLSINSTLELSRYRDLTAAGGREWDVAYGLSAVTHVWTPPAFSSIEAGLVMSRHVLSQESKPVGDRFEVYHVTGRLFAEKIQVSARWAPGRAWSLSLGFSDLNGLLYWWLR